MGGVGKNRRQLNATLTLEQFDRVCRAARKANMTRSAYATALLVANLDVIDPEGEGQQVQDAG
jgi:hypothetical protein